MMATLCMVVSSDENAIKLAGEGWINMDWIELGDFNPDGSGSSLHQILSLVHPSESVELTQELNWKIYSAFRSKLRGTTKVQLGDWLTANHGRYATTRLV